MEVWKLSSTSVRRGEGALGVQAWRHLVQAACAGRSMNLVELATAMFGDPSRLAEADRGVWMVRMYCFLSALPPLNAVAVTELVEESRGLTPIDDVMAYDWRSLEPPSELDMEAALSRLVSQFPD